MKNAELFGLTCFRVKLEITRPQLGEDLKYLVLESDPSPDYYARNDFPPNAVHANNQHLYLLVKNRINCFQDVVLRHKDEIKEKAGLNPHKNRIYPGSMTFKNDTYQCIRIDTVDAGKLPNLIEELQKFGVRFVKDQSFKPYSSFVFYKRYVDYIRIEEGVYQDSIDTNSYFIHVDTHLEMEEFLTGIEHIKNKCEFHQFDAFLTYMIYKNQVRDFVGIYSKHCEQARLGELKKEIETTFVKK